MECEAETEIQEPETYIPQITNNQYAALVGEEENEGNDNKSTGVDNDSEIIGVRHDKKIKGVDSDNESAESGSTGATYEADELALIEEAVADHNGILRKRLVYYQELRPKLKRHETKM